MRNKYKYIRTVKIAWLKCCSVWRTSVHSSQYLWPVLTTSIVRSAVVIENLNRRSKVP